jgi:hypothetical protein
MQGSYNWQCVGAFRPLRPQNPGTAPPQRTPPERARAMEQGPYRQKEVGSAQTLPRAGIPGTLPTTVPSYLSETKRLHGLPAATKGTMKHAMLPLEIESWRPRHPTKALCFSQSKAASATSPKGPLPCIHVSTRVVRFYLTTSVHKNCLLRAWSRTDHRNQGMLIR